ncbi:MAG: LCP family protein [Lachnospiraceae bacterium]|nr:LCP family protein [Lachnospiraceae bacterium]
MPSEKKPAKAKKNKSRSATARTRRKMAVFIVEILIIIGMIGILYYVMKQTENEEDEGPIYANVSDVDPSQIGISESVLRASEAGGPMEGYTNIALFGVDALSPKGSDLLKGYRSDTIIIASINNATGEVSLVSVYRDTYLNLGNDSYNKCNAAYAKGGATQAVTMLNANLDLNITNWVTVSYKALTTVVDDLGGIMIDVGADEIEHLNNYQIAVAQVLGIPENEIVPVRETGTQRLNGMQVSAYCRIRYTDGNDFARTARQREVIASILTEAKKCDAAKLTDIFTDVMNYTYTSFDEKTLLNMILSINDYTIVREGGFPSMDMMAGANLPAKGDCVVPVNLSDNVAWLHEFLFNDTAYVPSDCVTMFTSQIEQDTRPYIRS